MSRKASFGGTDAMRRTKNRSRLHPTGGLRPAWTEPPASHYVPHMPKRSQTQNRTFHLLFKADILTCYEHGTNQNVQNPEEHGQEELVNG